jgi:hypothetical protein
MEVSTIENGNHLVHATIKELEILEETFGKHQPFANVFQNLSQHFETRLRKNDRGKEYKDRATSYHFVPLRLGRMVERLSYVKEFINSKFYTEKDPSSFLDAGCGPGNVLLMAQAMQVRKSNARSLYHGIELDKQGAAMARILLLAKPPTRKSPWNWAPSYIYNTDILTFRHYKRYNMIYYYCPIHLSPLQALFEERMEDTIKVGTLVLPNLKRSSAIAKDDDRFKIIECWKGPNNYMNTPTWRFFQKVSDGKRTSTSLQEGDADRIPKKYRKVFKEHIKGVKYERGGLAY